MDEELVSTYSSVKRGGAIERPTSLFAYLLPYYLSYGMTSDEFWFGEPDLAGIYRQKHLIELQQKNQEMWLQGQYFLAAIGTVMSKDCKYPKEPFALTEEEQRERDERDAFERAQLYLSTFMKQYNNKKEGEING